MAGPRGAQWCSAARSGLDLGGRQLGCVREGRLRRLWQEQQDRHRPRRPGAAHHATPRPHPTPAPLQCICTAWRGAALITSNCGMAAGRRLRNRAGSSPPAPTQFNGPRHRRGRAGPDARRGLLGRGLLPGPQLLVRNSWSRLQSRLQSRLSIQNKSRTGGTWSRARPRRRRARRITLDRAKEDRISMLVRKRGCPQGRDLGRSRLHQAQALCHPDLHRRPQPGLRKRCAPTSWPTPVGTHHSGWRGQAVRTAPRT